MASTLYEPQAGMLLFSPKVKPQKFLTLYWTDKSLRFTLQPPYLWGEFQVSTGNTSRYLLERVLGLYWKELHVSIGKSSRETNGRSSKRLLITVICTTGNSSRDLLQSVPGSCWKQFQVYVRKKAVWAKKHDCTWRESNNGRSARNHITGPTLWCLWRANVHSEV